MKDTLLLGSRLKAQVQHERILQQVDQGAREAWYLRQMMKSTPRLQQESLARAMARYLTRWESEMKMGEEMNHVTDLLHSSSMRGPDDLGI